MIARISGKIADKANGRVVVDVGGVGYLVFVPLSAVDRLPSCGEDVSLHTTLVVREDSLSLYGFITAEEQQAFEQLLGVSGVGPKMALSIISALGVKGLSAAVATGDTAALARVSGVGKKTAGRVVLDLRGKLEGLTGAPYSGLADVKLGTSSAATAKGGAAAEAAAALEALGYTPAEASQALDAALRRLGEAGSVEALVRESLRELAGGQ